MESKMLVTLSIIVTFLFSIWWAYSLTRVEEIVHIVKVKQTQRSVEQEIVHQAQLAGIDAQKALDIAHCESRFDPYARNKNSSAKGVYQFIDKTWANYCDGDVFNYQDNIQCFMKLYPLYEHWWECH